MSYKIKHIPAHWSTYSAGRRGKNVEYIFVHYTATNASALNNCKYFAGGNRQASAHYFLDGSGVIYQSVPDTDTAWSVGNWDLNTRSISIEVVSDGVDFTAAEIEELTWLVGTKMAEYGVPANHVLRHYDALDYVTTGRTVSGHKACPAPYLDNAKWNALHATITGSGAYVAPAPAPAPTPSTEGFGGVYRVNVDALNVRTAPGLNSGVVAQYHYGETVTLQDWYTIADGYVWGRYVGYSGNTRYIAVGRATGKPEPNDYLIKQ